MNKKRWFLLLLFIPCCSLAMENGSSGGGLTEAQEKEERKAEKRRRRLLVLASRQKGGGEPRGEVLRWKSSEKVSVKSPPTLKGCPRTLRDLAKTTESKLAPNSDRIAAFSVDGTPSKLLKALAGQKRPREGVLSYGGYRREKPMALYLGSPAERKRPGLDGVVALSKALFDFMMERRDSFEGISFELRSVYDLMRLTIEEGSPHREYSHEELGHAASIIRDLLLSQYGFEGISLEGSFDDQLMISRLDKSVRNDILSWEALVRRFRPDLKNENLSRLVLLHHIVRGNSEGGGHFMSEWSLDSIDEGSVVDDKFEPITNKANGVVVLHRRFKGKLASEPKSQFPSGTSDKKVFELAVLIGQSSSPYAENGEYLARDNCRCVLERVSLPSGDLWVEIIDEALDSTGFGTIRSCYPIFSFTSLVEDQSVYCLAEVKHLDSCYVHRLELSSDVMVEFAQEAVDARAAGSFINNPIRYERDDTYIIDLAPLLKRKQEDGSGHFWDALPDSIVPKGIYVEIPKDRIII